MRVILEDGEYICGWAIEKMSKSMFNVVNPDHICEGMVPIRSGCMKALGPSNNPNPGYQRY